MASTHTPINHSFPTSLLVSIRVEQTKEERFSSRNIRVWRHRKEKKNLGPCRSKLLSSIKMRNPGPLHIKKSYIVKYLLFLELRRASDNLDRGSIVRLAWMQVDRRLKSLGPESTIEPRFLQEWRSAHSIFKSSCDVQAQVNSKAWNKPHVFSVIGLILARSASSPSARSRLVSEVNHLSVHFVSHRKFYCHHLLLYHCFQKATSRRHDEQLPATSWRSNP